MFLDSIFYLNSALQLSIYFSYYYKIQHWGWYCVGYYLILIFLGSGGPTQSGRLCSKTSTTFEFSVGSTLDPVCIKSMVLQLNPEFTTPTSYFIYSAAVKDFIVHGYNLLSYTHLTYTFSLFFFC